MDSEAPNEIGEKCGFTRIGFGSGYDFEFPYKIGQLKIDSVFGVRRKFRIYRICAIGAV